MRLRDLREENNAAMRLRRWGPGTKAPGSGRNGTFRLVRAGCVRRSRASDGKRDTQPLEIGKKGGGNHGPSVASTQPYIDVAGFDPLVVVPWSPGSGIGGLQHLATAE